MRRTTATTMSLAALLLVPIAAGAQSLGGGTMHLYGPNGYEYGPNNPMPVTGSTSAGASTVTYGNGGGTIANGGTAQNALAANSITHGFDLVNPASATEPLYFSLNGPATTTSSSPSLSPGTAYHGAFGTAQALSVNAATTGHPFTVLGY